MILSNGRAEDTDCDSIIVLGAQVKQSGPSVALQFRLDAATDYLKEHQNTKCIASGGQENHAHPSFPRERRKENTCNWKKSKQFPKYVFSVVLM